MKLLLNIAFVSFVGMMVGGCNSAPPSVQASRPLVESVIPTASKTEVPVELWESLSSEAPGNVVEYEKLQVTLGLAYYSGLGELCRKVEIKPLEITPDSINSYFVENRIVCLQESSNKWMLIPVVIDEQSDTRGFN
ncbi:hypothetical protein [Shewanella japonica]|uniref:hypothetical protein n=1 Tax=Shewanella japonica TaxID=93973 RepID=UPI002493DFB4|nr:hypothetical protein [Shewanella japonica]